MNDEQVAGLKEFIHERFRQTDNKLDRVLRDLAGMEACLRRIKDITR
jgi:hypothetical protein